MTGEILYQKKTLHKELNKFRWGYTEYRKTNGLWICHMAQFAPGNPTA